MCQLSEPMLQMTKCKAQQEEEFKRTARAEFQEKLRETSADLRQLLASHLKEFRSVSSSLIWFAESETMLKLQHSSHRLSSSSFELSNNLDATKQLFSALIRHMTTYQSGTASIVAGGSFAQQVRYSYSSVADINQEIGYYFKRLHLIQAKRLLEHRQQVSLNLDCLDANLPSQQHVEAILGELWADSSANEEPKQDSNHTASTSSEQMKLTLSIKQSLEFARTLLSSLSLANDMFRNITERIEDWMPNEQCHRALARMTVCQQCHPSSSAATAAAQQVGGSKQQVGGSPRRWVTLGSAIGAPFADQSTATAPVRLVAPASGASGAPFVASPCENYCLNVVGGCMGDLYELNRVWSEHVSALARFKTNMIQMNNIESVMSTLADRLLSFMGKLRHLYSAAIERQAGNDATRDESIVEAPTKTSNSKPVPLKSTEVSAKCILILGQVFMQSLSLLAARAIWTRSELYRCVRALASLGLNFCRKLARVLEIEAKQFARAPNAPNVPHRQVRVSEARKFEAYLISLAASFELNFGQSHRSLPLTCELILVSLRIAFRVLDAAEPTETSHIRPTDRPTD